MDAEENRSFFNSRANLWDQTVIHNPRRIESLIKLLEIKKGDAVLDVGTGTGVLIPYLLMAAGNDCRITAIDLAENMIEVARAKFSGDEVEFICGDVADYPLPANFFDIVVCYSVFPHFVDPAGVLARLADLLKPGGRLLVCHSESRDTINSRHRELGRDSISRGLPPSPQVAGLFAQAGLQVIAQADTAELYYVLGLKPL